MKAAAKDEGMGARKVVFEGTHRTVHEPDTLRRLTPLLPHFGITRVANVTGLDDVGVPVVTVMRPQSRSLTVAQGKGLTLAAAKVSGIMESIEQYQAERIQLPLHFGSYRDRAAAGRPPAWTRLPRAGRPLDPFARLLWVDGISARTGDIVEVPFAAVTLDMSQPHPPGHEYFPVSSNGLASGNVLAEAIAHGLWEVIERDALALFYRRSLAEQSRRRLRLDTVSGLSARSLLDAFHRAGVGVALWDITSDLQVPAFLCSVVERDLDPFRRVGLARGCGCHPDVEVAVCRALCEAAQTRLTRIAGSRDDLSSEEFRAVQQPEFIRRHQAQLAEPQHRSFQEVSGRVHTTFGEDLDWALQCLESAGIDDFVYVDISPRELPMKVVRVVVSELEGPAEVPGYQPGPRARALEISE